MAIRRSLTHGFQAINWHVILVLTICLIAVHFLFFQHDYNPQETQLQIGNVVPSLNLQSRPHSTSVHGGEQTSTPTVEELLPIDAVPYYRKPSPTSQTVPNELDTAVDGLNPEQEDSMAEGLAPLSDETVPTGSESSSEDSEEVEEIEEEMPASEVTEVLESAPNGDSNVEDDAEIEDGAKLDEEAEVEEIDTEEEIIENEEDYEEEAEVDDEEEYVAICLAIKDQYRDLPEWFIHHYYHLGIRRFYIMDDGSDPPISTRDIDYGIPKSAITFHYQERETRGNWMQLTFYQQCNNWWGSEHSWIAYIDVDEFLEVTTPNETFSDILKSFDDDESVGALGVNWQLHNSNGILTRPESVRQSFTTCLYDSPEELHGGTGDNYHIKSIVKTAFFTSAQNPHKFGLRDGAMTVGENGDIINSYAFRSPITRDRISLHHYAVKSREEFEEKLLRSNAMTDPKDENFWNHMENLVPTVNCTEMAQYDP